MKQYMEKRIISIAHYTIDHNSTVRSTAKKFGISKSTVHKDLTERLPQIDHHLAGEVREVLEINKNSGTGSSSHHDQAFFPIGQQNCDNKSRCG